MLLADHFSNDQIGFGENQPSVTYSKILSVPLLFLLVSRWRKCEVLLGTQESNGIEFMSMDFNKIIQISNNMKVSK